jgi:hypothetical protein
MTPDTESQKLARVKQGLLDTRLINAATEGDTETVRTLLAAGAQVHELNDLALRCAAQSGHTDTVKVLLAAGANMHAGNDYALCLAALCGHTETVKALLAAGANMHAQDDWAVRNAAFSGHTETVKVLANHIFAPESWRGKSRAEIEAEARALYGKVEGENPQPERLRAAGSILIDCALTCWEQVKPAPPKIQISPFPAKPRPV